MNRPSDDRSAETRRTALDLAIHLQLDRFELDVELETQSPVTGLFGASGAGKTSLLETIAGLRRGATGHVRLGGEVWLSSRDRRFVPPEHRRIGYVPQDGLLFPHLNVRRNLLAGSRRARLSDGDSQTTLGAVADLLELTPLLDRHVATLSGGERQRVSLGRALCSGPALLLLDEPLAALDLPLRRRLLPFLSRVRQELTVPMILVSHDPTEVQALCDDVVVLRHGRVFARGEPRSVLRDAKVFSLASQEGYENILPGHLLKDGEATRHIRLGGRGSPVELVVPGSDVATGEVLVGLPANEIMIATERPRGLSARNVLPARIVEIRTHEQGQQGHLGVITADLGHGVPPIVVEVTETTPGQLGLTPECQVFLVIKATSCRLYGGSVST